MRPAGARQRGQPPPPRPGASRNEAFENIFGRPAVNHHLGQTGGPSAGSHHPSAPAGAGYGYAPTSTSTSSPYPSQSNGSVYISPAQPSLSPGHGYAAPPPRAASYGHAGAHGYPAPAPVSAAPNFSQRAPGAYEGSSSGHGRPAPQAYSSNLSAQTADLPPSRRASLAPSTYSTHSTASFYSPQPDAPSPPLQQTGRMPSATYSARESDYDHRPSGRLPPPSTLAPAPYASAYDAISSPTTSTFPRSSASPASGPSMSSTSLGTTSSSTRSPSVRTNEHSASRSPPIPEEGRNGHGAGNVRSPPPDYTKSLSNLSIETGKGYLDDIPGLPKVGDTSDLADLAAKWSPSEDFMARGSSQPARARSGADQGRSSFGSLSSTHRRMPSDSSISSSSYTMTGRDRMMPLSAIDQSPQGARDYSFDSPTTPTGSESGAGGFAAHAVRRLSGRKSMDSTQSLPLLNNGSEASLPPGAAPSTSAFDARATSFSGSSTARREALAAVRSGSIGHNATRRPGSNPPSSFGLSTPLPSQRSLSGTLTRQSSSRAATIRNMPTVYPALLSRVAEAFKQLLVLSEIVKDGITYKDAFDGRMAVGIIGEIIKTPDRNLALLLGRALDAQKFFHDVTYDHRLRDSANEVYQFKERLTAPYINDNPVTDSPMSDHAGLARAQSSGRHTQYTGDSGSIQNSDSASFFTSQNPTPATSTTTLNQPSSPHLSKVHSGGTVPLPVAEAMDAEDDDLPQGVFTLLTDCYSPTCSRDSLCYSINCPRRLEQMKRLNMKPQPGLTRKISEESLHDVKETGTLWIESVSQEILDSVDDTEKKRQEAINEVIYTERDFVRDLEYLRDFWILPLRTQDVLPADRKDHIVQQIFWNVYGVLSVNAILGEKLTKRQKQQPVVKAIGDIFLEIVPKFAPFVEYGGHQLWGKYEYEQARTAHPAFAKFADETERKPESRKLELNGYLTKPTTRLGRYPLLLGAVLKYTPDDHPDKADLQKCIDVIKKFLSQVNEASGRAENAFELAQIEEQLVFRQHEKIDLRLKDKSRELVHKGPLKRRGGTRDEIADLMGFLFDHALLLVKPKAAAAKGEQLRVYRRPIPLELLVVNSPDETYNLGKLSTGRAKLMARPSATSKTGSGSHVPPKPESKHGFSITITHLGKKGYQLQLWVDSYVGRKKWLEAIDKQQGALREKSQVFVSETITDGFFGGLRKINCLSPYDQGHRMIYGTDEGVYFSNLRDEKLREPVKVISLLDVTQVDVIEEFQLLIVLHERSVTTFPLDCLDPSDPNAALKRGKRISSHTSFFKSGICLGKTLVAVVKSSTLSSTIKVLEPVDQSQRGKKPQTSFMKRLNGGNEALKLFKEFYIPTESSSVHFLKTKLTVGCTKGFEIVDLETLDMQGLLDPSDKNLDFVLKRDNVRPVAIYRIEEDFLLCYDEFAFYVNKNGWRARGKWAIVWEGMPTAFAMQYPYVIAFEPSFVEVHHVESGHLVQIIPGTNISCLFADTPPSRVNAPVLPPNRQLMYPPPHPGHPGQSPSFRPAPGPSQSPYGQQWHPQQSYATAHPGQPPVPHLAPHARPPMGPTPGSYGVPMPMQPPQMPQPQARFARQQIIFTSEDGHVQFLKLPPPQMTQHQHQHHPQQAQRAVSGGGSGAGAGPVMPPPRGRVGR